MKQCAGRKDARTVVRQAVGCNASTVGADGSISVRVRVHDHLFFVKVINVSRARHRTTHRLEQHVGTVEQLHIAVLVDVAIRDTHGSYGLPLPVTMFLAPLAVTLRRIGALALRTVALLSALAALAETFRTAMTLDVDSRIFAKMLARRSLTIRSRVALLSLSADLTPLNGTSSLTLDTLVVVLLLLVALS